MRRMFIAILAAIFTGFTMIYFVQYVVPILEPVMTATTALPQPEGNLVWFLIVVPVGVGGPIFLYFAIFRLLSRVAGSRS